VVEAIEGPLAMVACAGGNCDHQSFCPADAVWQEVQESIRAVLQRASLESLVSSRMGQVPEIQAPAKED
jgi:DNA-binding IscR family transcriptional regulator